MAMGSTSRRWSLIAALTLLAACADPQLEGRAAGLRAEVERLEGVASAVEDLRRTAAAVAAERAALEERIVDLEGTALARLAAGLQASLALDYQGAARHFEDLTREHPGDPLLRVAAVAADRNRDALAEVVLQRVAPLQRAGKLSEANEVLERVIARFGDTPAGQRARALHAENRVQIERDRAAAAGGAPLLELRAFSWHATSINEVQATGTVLNLSDEPLRNILAEVVFLDDAGGFVASESAILARNPLLPAQRSTFTVTQPYSRAMVRGEVRFRQMGGGLLPSREALE